MESETELIRVMAAQPDTNVLGDEIPDGVGMTDSFVFDDFDPLRPGGSDWNVWMIRFILPPTVAFFPVLPVL
jgi:hypothetical protein